MKPFYAITLFILCTFLMQAQSQKLTDATKLKVSLKGMSEENRINLEDYLKNDSILISGVNSADYMIVKGKIGLVIRGEAKEVNFFKAKNGIIGFSSNTMGSEKSFNLFYDDVIVKNIKTGATIKIPNTKIVVIKN